jgi:predicted transposase YbfD/YdcC
MSGHGRRRYPDFMLLQNQLTSHFGALPDPRYRRARKHELLDILFIALCAVICGAESFAEIAQWGRSKQEWLQSFLLLPSGIPSHDTFGRVFARLDRQAFARCFQDWTQSLHQKTEGQVIAVDGKWLRGSFDTATQTPALKLVSAWASEARLVLAQQAIEPGSNEIATLPTLLKMLDMGDCIVTIDAAGCQKNIAKQIIKQKGDYVLSLKGNQEFLRENVEEQFTDWEEKDWQIPFAYQKVRSCGKGHGRIEIRECYLVEASDFVDPRGEWQGLRSIAMITSERQVGEKVSVERRYYLTSLSGADAARHVLRSVRRHWGIENRLHWVLDVVYQEDKCRVRTGHAAQNLSVLRQITLNLLRSSPDKSTSLRMKRKRAGWELGYLEEILTGVPMEERKENATQVATNL